MDNGGEETGAGNDGVRADGRTDGRTQLLVVD